MLKPVPDYTLAFEMPKVLPLPFTIEKHKLPAEYTAVLYLSQTTGSNIRLVMIIQKMHVCKSYCTSLKLENHALSMKK